MRSVHPTNGFASPLTVVSPFGKLRNDERGIVVALLRALVELPCPVEQGRDARDTVSAIKSHLESARYVPWKFVSTHEVVDLDVICLRVEFLDFAESVVTTHTGAIAYGFDRCKGIALCGASKQRRGVVKANRPPSPLLVENWAWQAGKN